MAERQSARMSKITHDGLTRSGMHRMLYLQLCPYDNSRRQSVNDDDCHGCVWATDTSRRCGSCVIGWQWLTAAVTQSSTAGWTTSFAPDSVDYSAVCRVSSHRLTKMELDHASRMRSRRQRRWRPLTWVTPTTVVLDASARRLCPIVLPRLQSAV